MNANLQKVFKEAKVASASGEQYSYEEMRKIVDITSPQPQMLVISARTEDPQRAKEIANGVAKEGMEEVNSVFDQERELLIGKARKHYDETRQELNKQEQEYLDLAKQSGLDEKKAQIEMLQEESKNLQRDVVTYEADIQKLESTLKVSRETIKNIEPKKVYTKSVAQSPETLAALAQSGVKPSSSMLAAEMKEETPNPTYEEIERTIPQQEIELGSAKSMYEDRKKTFSAVMAEIEKLRPAVIELQQKVDRAKDELTMARTAYNQANDSLWSLKSRQTGRVQPFMVINPAHAPQLKDGPHRAAIILGVMVVVFFMTCVALLLKDAYIQRQKAYQENR